MNDMTSGAPDYPGDEATVDEPALVIAHRGKQPRHCHRCLDRVYDLKVLKAKAKKTLAATGQWDAAEFAWTSNLSYREIGMSKSTFALV